MCNAQSCFLLFFVLILGGCATTPQQPISLAEGAIIDTSTVGIVVSPIPKTQTAYPGAGCLLCLATASAMNSSLSDHISTLSAEDLKQVSIILHENLEKMGHQPVLIEEPFDVQGLEKLDSKEPDTAKFNFSRYGERYDVDFLLVIQLDFVGVQRNYASYIPKGDPQAVVMGVAYMVNLENHQYLWYKPLQIFQSAEGEWDEPPAFPGMTNAFYQALERAIDAVNEPFISSEAVSSIQ